MTDLTVLPTGIATDPAVQIDTQTLTAIENAPPIAGTELKLVAAQTVFLGGIFLFCLLGACYVAANILLPIFLALLMKFVLHPLVRGGQRWRIPSGVSSVLIIVVLLTAFVGLGSAVSEPVGKWTGRLQEAMPQLKEQLGFIKNRLTGMQEAISSAEHVVPGSDTKAVVVSVRGTTLTDRLLAGTGHFASGLLETIIILLFLLISGDTFLRRLVEVLPRFQDKKHAVAISQQVENDLSAYLLTITLANLCLGIATGVAMRMLGIEDPLLWGVLAFTLNYVPIIGPILMTGIVFIVGSIGSGGNGGGAVIDGSAAGLLPAGIFFAIHLCESQMITPLLLARRFTLNPVLIILSLTFWFWMWGIVGAILATPMLAVAKIICDRIEPLQPLGHLIEGNSSRTA